MKAYLFLNSDQTTFKDVYDRYIRTEGYVTPALCFLTILHLANENNLCCN